MNDGRVRTMEVYISRNSDNKKNASETRSDSIFRPTIPATLVSIFSGAVSYANAPTPQMDTIDSISLGILVAVGTYLAAKVGKKAGGVIGSWTGGLLGGSAGVAVGTAAGSTLGDKGKKVESAALGGLVGGAAGTITGAIALAILGYTAGFFGGAYAGHVYTEKAAMKYFFNKPSAAPTQSINLPKQDVPAMIAAFKP